MTDPLLRHHHLHRFHLEHLGLTLLLGLFCVVMVLTGALASFDRRLYDTLSTALPAEPEPGILLVTIDDFSLRQLGRWPWDRSLHARLIDRLNEQGARAVLYDVMLAEQDSLRPGSDLALADAIARHGRVYLPVHVEQLRGGQLVEALPWRQFAESAHRLGHVDLVQDGDGVVRSLWLRSGVAQAFWPHIALAVLEDEKPALAQQFQRRQRGESGARQNVREYLRLVPFSRGDYPRVSAADVIDGRVPPQLLDNRIVLVGTSAEGLGDLFRTPLAQDLRMPGVEIHARVLSALLEERLISDAPLLMSVMISLMVAMMAPLWLPFCAPRWGVPMLAALMLAGLLLSIVLLRSAQLWWSPGAALLTILLTGPLWTWRRLEYSLDYLKTMIRRTLRPGEQGGRLTQPAEMAQLLRMLKVLPLRAWRLENRVADELQVGGETIEDASWQGQSARHYPLRRRNSEFELSVVWNSPALAEQMDGVIRAMIARVSAPATFSGPALRSVVEFIDSLDGMERRQRGLTRALHASLSRLDMGVLVADACGEVLLANQRLLSQLELDSRPLQGWHLLDMGRDLRLEPACWSALVASALEEGQARQDLLGRHGECMQLTLIRVEAGGQVGQILLLEIEDVTELARVRDTRPELLKFLSHDLRSPMISILALTEKMRQSPGSTPLSDFLSQLDMHARRNLGVAEQFLQLIRVESMPRIEMIELDMLPVVESAIEQVRAEASSADVTLRLDYRDDEPVWVCGNHELLVRLLINLLSNAVRHSVPGSSVDVRLYTEGQKVCCDVRDRGPGIPAERQVGLFSQLQAGGKGLGLRFVTLVAHRHGGRIMLESRPGEGARFTLALPALVLDEL